MGRGAEPSYESKNRLPQVSHFVTYSLFEWDGANSEKGKSLARAETRKGRGIGRRPRTSPEHKFIFLQLALTWVGYIEMDISFANGGHAWRFQKVNWKRSSAVALSRSRRIIWARQSIRFQLSEKTRLPRGGSCVIRRVSPVSRSRGTGRLSVVSQNTSSGFARFLVQRTQRIRRR